MTNKPANMLDERNSALHLEATILSISQLLTTKLTKVNLKQEKA